MSCDVSRLRYRGGSVLVPALPICPAFVPSSSRAVVSFPVSPRHAACLARRLCPLGHLSRHLGQFACLPLCVPPCVPFLATPLVSLLVSLLVPFSPGMSSPPYPDRSPCCSACGHRSPRHACRGTGSGTGRDCLSRHRLPALPPLLALGWRGAVSVPIAASCLLARPVIDLCLYCDGGIVYIICPVAII